MLKGEREEQTRAQGSMTKLGHLSRKTLEQVEQCNSDCTLLT